MGSLCACGCRSIGISGLMVYTGDRFPQWRGNLFVGGMVGQRLSRLTLDGQRVINEETLGCSWVAFGTSAGPDGLIYLVTDDRDGKPTPILRLEPVDRLAAIDANYEKPVHLTSSVDPRPE